MVLLPGQSTLVGSSVFTMHAGMEGAHLFRVHLRSNDPDRPGLYVDVRSNWIP
jgi:hypothetical protein